MQKQIKARCRKQVLVATTLTSSLFVVRSSTSNQHFPALHHPASQQLHRRGSTGSALSCILAPKVKKRTLNMQLMFPYILPQIIFLQPCSCRHNQITCSLGNSPVTSPEAQKLRSRCPDCCSSCAAAPSEPRDQNMSRSQHSGVKGRWRPSLPDRTLLLMLAHYLHTGT